MFLIVQCKDVVVEEAIDAVEAVEAVEAVAEVRARHRVAATPEDDAIPAVEGVAGVAAVEAVEAVAAVPAVTKRQHYNVYLEDRDDQMEIRRTDGDNDVYEIGVDEATQAVTLTHLE